MSSFTVINGRQIELLDETDLFDDQTISSKHNNVLFADNSGNIRIQRSFEEQEPIKKKPVIKRKYIIKCKSLTSNLPMKRKIAEAYGTGGMHDEERYGREISPHFFKTNIGHGVYPNQIHIPEYNEVEIINWCYKYIASKKA